ncbi:MAG: hypothetical protein KGJ07_08905, partial [Patescibacteria group bacterium]|nr:hypothetical protein [Patescibacteria group bacterium]
TYLQAKPQLLFNPINLNDISMWAVKLSKLRDVCSPRSQLWLGEIGNAMYGGQSGISDTFESTLWWADALGLMAVNKQQVVVRQDLIGANYSLLDKQTFDPLPDYWVSFLWKRLMGTKILHLQSFQINAFVRFYASLSEKVGNRQDLITVLLINLQAKTNTVEFLNLNIRNVMLYQLTAKTLIDKVVLLNGKPLTFNKDKVPVVKGKSVKLKNNTVTLLPFSITFLTFTRERNKG